MAQKALSAQDPIFMQGTRFDRLVSHIVGIEGGYNNIKEDNGGATKYGISLRFLIAEGKIDLDQNGFADFDLDMDGDIDGADIRALTPIQAKNLYYTCFWMRYRCYELPEKIDGAVFDQAINGGGVSAVKMLQNAINRTFPRYNLLVDGVLGNKTIAAINGINNRDNVLSMYRYLAAQRYRGIVAQDPKQVKFLRGWLNRAAGLGNV